MVRGGEHILPSGGGRTVSLQVGTARAGKQQSAAQAALAAHLVGAGHQSAVVELEARVELVPAERRQESGVAA